MPRRRSPPLVWGGEAGLSLEVQMLVLVGLKVLLLLTGDSRSGAYAKMNPKNPAYDADIPGCRADPAFAPLMAAAALPAAPAVVPTTTPALRPYSWALMCCEPQRGQEGNISIPRVRRTDNAVQAIRMEAHRSDMWVKNSIASVPIPVQLEQALSGMPSDSVPPSKLIGHSEVLGGSGRQAGAEHLGALWDRGAGRIT